MNFAFDHIQHRQHTPVADQPRPGMKYVVAPGDSLSVLGFKAYGDYNSWGAIYTANINQIGNNPNLIISGSVLYIPDLEILGDAYDPEFEGHKTSFVTNRRQKMKSPMVALMNRKVVSIQMLPFVTAASNGDQKQIVECQTTGSDRNTEGYGIYLRLNDGTVSHYDDEVSEHAAIKMAERLSTEHAVFIEPYPWQRGLVNPPVEEKAFTPPMPFVDKVLKATNNTGGFMAKSPEVVFVWNHHGHARTYNLVANPGQFIDLDANNWDLTPATLDEIFQAIINPAIALAEEQAAAARKPKPNFEYVTKEGDMFAELAVAAYGDASLAAIIVGANRDKDIHSAHLPANITLRIPPDLSDRNKAAAGQQYITQLGDTLERIANQVYGDPAMAHYISDANRDIDSHRVVNGYLPKDMCLDIPEFAKREEKPTTYTTKLGESLKGAAMAIYGDTNMWRALKVANNLAGGEAMADMPLAIDTVLQIPKQF